MCFFFFTLGNVGYSSLLPEQRVTGFWEEKRLMFSSISKCLLILNFYLGQSIFSSFSSSSCPLVALNSVFAPLADAGENMCCALKNKKGKKEEKESFTSQELGMFSNGYRIQKSFISIDKSNLVFFTLQSLSPLKLYKFSKFCSLNKCLFSLNNQL